MQEGRTCIMITSYHILPELWHMYAGHCWDGERQGSVEVLGNKSDPVLLCLARLSHLLF